MSDRDPVEIPVDRALIELAERLQYKLQEALVLAALADYAHEAWSGWMNYLFARCTDNEDGSVTIPASLVARWKRQAATDYPDLSDEEKDTDIDEAQKILRIVQQTLLQLVASHAAAQKGQPSDTT